MSDNIITAVHSGDLHLGAGRRAGTEAKEERFSVFERLLALCRKEKADVLLLAGDLLEQDSLGEAGLLRVKTALGKLAEEGTKVFVSPGNHDPASPLSPYRREGFWPEGVKIFIEPETVICRDKGFSVSGAGFTALYQRQSLLPAITESYERAEAKGLTEGVPLTLNLMHAELRQGAGGLYNPVEPAEIAASPFAYTALGHIHIPDRTPKAAGRGFYAYCGAAQGLSARDDGDRGALLLRFEEGHLAGSEFVPLAITVYRTFSPRLRQAEDMTQALEQIRRQLDQVPKAPGEARSVWTLCLEGESGGHYIPDTDALRLALENEGRLIRRFDDNSRQALDEAKLEAEESLRGLFYREMRSLEEKAPDGEKALYHEALRLGLDAFRGELTE